MSPIANVRVGTSGWSYDDWKGVFYPSTGAGDRLAYLADYFDCTEVNATFYRPPEPGMTRSWLDRTPEAFEFAMKLHQRFTHQREAPWTRDEAEEYLRGARPALEAGRLGAVLVQFPWSFRAGDDAYKWVEKVTESFGELPLVIEVRHVSWTDESALRFIADAGLGFANIDQPSSRGGVPPMTLVTSPVGYVRLHGRNRSAWFNPKSDRDAKYDYLYAESELDDWIPRIRKIARESEKTYVFTNNHYRGQAPANALQIMAKLGGEPVGVPEPLVQAYPVLEHIAADEPPTPGEQGALF